MGLSWHQPSGIDGGKVARSAVYRGAQPRLTSRCREKRCLPLHAILRSYPRAPVGLALVPEFCRNVKNPGRLPRNEVANQKLMALLVQDERDAIEILLRILRPLVFHRERRDPLRKEAVVAIEDPVIAEPKAGVILTRQRQRIRETALDIHAIVALERERRRPAVIPNFGASLAGEDQKLLVEVENRQDITRISGCGGKV